jgi:arylsulfatase
VGEGVIANSGGIMTERIKGRDVVSAGRAATVVLLVLVITLLAAVLIRVSFGPPSVPQNVLLIVADTLRADHLGCYGFARPTSPRIDALASEGVLFSDFNTVVPATLPSFSSLLTSRHVKDHRACRNGFPLEEKFPLLSEAFRDGGFQTAAFIASYCVSAAFGVARGFDHFDEEFDIDTGLPNNRLIRKAEGVSDAFISWLESRDGEKPFFAMVHYFDPHWPYDQPEPFRERFAPRGVDPRTGGIQAVLDTRAYLETGGAPTDLCRTLHGLYCGEIAYMDQQIGRVLDALAAAGIDEETLVVVTADHGETFWEHGDYFDHGLYVYDTNVRIPLIFRWPGGVDAGRCEDVSLCNIDLGPTLLEMAGLTVPGTFAGKSFASLVLGRGGDSVRPVFSEACKPYDVEENAPRLNFNKAKSVRRGPWKLVLTPFLDNRLELFNVERDPAETTNLIRNPAHRAIVTELKLELDEWAGDYEGGRTRGEGLPYDEETREKLKRLGYAE